MPPPPPTDEELELKQHVTKTLTSQGVLGKIKVRLAKPSVICVTAMSIC